MCERLGCHFDDGQLTHPGCGWYFASGQVSGSYFVER